MDLHSQLERFRKEHDDILRFLKSWEATLDLLASEDEDARCKALAELREMEKKLAGLREHCQEEEQIVESPFQIYLDDRALEQFRREHDVLEQLTEGYRAELKFVSTIPPTTQLLGLGRRLLEQLRHHIAYEEGLLKQIEDGNEAVEKLFLRYVQPAE